MLRTPVFSHPENPISLNNYDLCFLKHRLSSELQSSLVQSSTSVQHFYSHVTDQHTEVQGTEFTELASRTFKYGSLDRKCHVQFPVPCQGVQTKVSSNWWEEMPCAWQCNSIGHAIFSNKRPLGFHGWTQQRYISHSHDMSNSMCPSCVKGGLCPS